MVTLANVRYFHKKLQSQHIHKKAKHFQYTSLKQRGREKEIEVNRLNLEDIHIRLFVSNLKMSISIDLLGILEMNHYLHKMNCRLVKRSNTKSYFALTFEKLLKSC